MNIKTLSTTEARERMSDLIDIVSLVVNLLLLDVEMFQKLFLFLSLILEWKLSLITNINAYSKSFDFLAQEPEIYSIEDIKINMYKLGHIVLTPFPFTDLFTNKVRPALILGTQDRGDDITVCFIFWVIRE